MLFLMDKFENSVVVWTVITEVFKNDACLVT